MNNLLIIFKAIKIGQNFLLRIAIEAIIVDK